MTNSRAQKFADLLTQGIYQIHRSEKKSIRVIHEELGEALAYPTGSMIEYWRKGYLPQLPQVAILAREIIRRGKLDPGWLDQFLTSVGYIDRETLYRELFPVTFPDQPASK